MESGIIHIQEKDQEEIVLNFFSNITLNKPRNGYYLFINDMFAKEISKFRFLCKISNICNVGKNLLSPYKTKLMVNSLDFRSTY